LVELDSQAGTGLRISYLECVTVAWCDYCHPCHAAASTFSEVPRGLGKAARYY